MFPNYDTFRKTETYPVGCFSFIPLIRGYSARMNISKIELYPSLGTIQKYRILRKWRKIGIFILRRLRNPYWQTWNLLFIKLISTANILAAYINPPTLIHNSFLCTYYQPFTYQWPSSAQKVNSPPMRRKCSYLIMQCYYPENVTKPWWILMYIFLDFTLFLRLFHLL